MTPSPEAIALLTEMLWETTAIWEFANPKDAEVEDRFTRMVLAMLTHPPLAEALRTAELARAWWASCSGRGEGNVAGRPWAALADHLLATAEGGK